MDEYKSVLSSSLSLLFSSPPHSFSFLSPFFPLAAALPFPPYAKMTNAFRVPENYRGDNAKVWEPRLLVVRASGRIMYGSLILLRHSEGTMCVPIAREIFFRYGDYGAILAKEYRKLWSERIVSSAIVARQEFLASSQTSARILSRKVSLHLYSRFMLHLCLYILSLEYV